MQPTIKPFLVSLGFVTVLAGSVLLWSPTKILAPGKSALDTQQLQPASEAKPIAPVESASLQAAPTIAREKALVVQAGSLTLPDGSSVPCLNGVKDTLRLKWPGGAYSPIVSTRLDDRNLHWYVHADGSQSTTMIADGVHLGQAVQQPMAIHAKPLVGKVQKKLLSLDK